MDCEINYTAIKYKIKIGKLARDKKTKAHTY